MKQKTKSFFRHYHYAVQQGKFWKNKTDGRCFAIFLNFKT